MNLQKQIDTIFSSGGGTVWVPKGITVLDKALKIRSRVRLLGQGQFQSILRLAPGVKTHSVVMTAGFNPELNIWNYNAGKITGNQEVFNEINGLHVGCSVENLTIDGNNRNGTNSNGLSIYGGGFRVSNVGIMDCSGHGLWTQCGRADNSWAGDEEYSYWNMHESIIENISISNVGQHGVYFAGPNDSYMDKVQVKMAKDAGFYFDFLPNISTGGLKVGSIHTYACSGKAQIVIKSGALSANYIFSDTPNNTGIQIDGSGNLIDKILVMFHNRNRKSTTWGLDINGNSNYVGYYRYLNDEIASLTNPPLHGGALRVNGDFCSMPEGMLYGGGPEIKCKGEAVTGKKIFKGIVRW